MKPKQAFTLIELLVVNRSTVPCSTTFSASPGFERHVRAAGFRDTDEHFLEVEPVMTILNWLFRMELRANLDAETPRLSPQ